MPAYDQRRDEGDQTEDLIHRHRAASGEPDQADQEGQPELAAAEADQTADATDQQGAPESYRDRAPARQRGRAGRYRRTGHAPLGDTCSGERLHDPFGNAPWPLTQAEYPGRIATRIDLDDLRTGRDVDAAAGESPKNAPDWRTQGNRSYGCDDRAFLDPISYASTRDEATGIRCVDEALTSGTPYRPGLAYQGQGRAGLDDLPEPVTPHGLDGDIDVFASDEVWAEANREGCDTALRFGDRPLSHTGIDQCRPGHRLNRLSHRQRGVTDHVAGIQGLP